jgi:hypothetical protein
MKNLINTRHYISKSKNSILTLTKIYSKSIRDLSYMNFLIIGHLTSLSLSVYFLYNMNLLCIPTLIFTYGFGSQIVQHNKSIESKDTHEGDTLKD